MNVFKISEIMADENICIVCEDAEGVQWFGVGGAIYPAHGWPKLTRQQVGEVFYNGPRFHCGVNEVTFPNLTDVKDGHINCAERLALRLRTDYDQNVVAVRTSKGIAFVNERYIDACDAPSDEIWLREMTDSRENTAFIAEDADGNRHAIIMPIIATKSQIKALKELASEQFIERGKKGVYIWV